MKIVTTLLDDFTHEGETYQPGEIVTVKGIKYDQSYNSNCAVEVEIAAIVNKNGLFREGGELPEFYTEREPLHDWIDLGFVLHLTDRIDELIEEQNTKELIRCINTTKLSKEFGI